VFALSLAIGMCRSRRPSDNAYRVVVRFNLESLALHAAHVIHALSLRNETNCRIRKACCVLWYYHAMPKYKRIKQDKDAEVLLNRIEMQDLHRNFEIANGYISRFLAIFKPFVHMNHRHPRYLHMQLRMSKQFRDSFESEFGKTIDCPCEIDVEPEIEVDLWQLLLDFSDVMYASCQAGHVHFS
jgi:hypothetical protein